MNRIPAALLAALAFPLPWLLAACGGGGDGDYPDYDNPREPAAFTLAPESTGDGWVVSTPAAEGMEASALERTFQSIGGGTFPGVDSMVVVRHQRLVAEGYFNGFGRDTVHDLRSAGKSFVSTLAGLAFEQGLMDLDDPLAQHIPNFEGHRNMSADKRAITLRHLLNMSSGLDCNDWDSRSPGHEEKMYDSRDWIGFMLDLPTVATPGTRGSYCTGGVVLLGHVISLRSGMTLDAFAQQWLLGPLSIERSLWRHSPDGQATGGTGFGLRPRDAAKLGALFANEGVWNGRRIVSETWVEMTRQRVLPLGTGGYGYLWWKGTYPLGTGTVEAVIAAGNGGNYVFIVPSLELVVAFTGSNYNNPRSETPQQILPLVLSAVVM
jgi:CubicO group peptidase (beta-lactamase class C family)